MPPNGLAGAQPTTPALTRLGQTSPHPAPVGVERLCDGAGEAGISISGTSLLRWRRERLALGGCSADLDWLLREEAALDWGTLQRLRIEPDQPVHLKAKLARLELLWHRHCLEHEPLQYLVGRCPWRDVDLAVAPGVLIPRQESELLVEIAQRLSGSSVPHVWADLGTGSGCLAVALARLWPAAAGFGVDVSPEALRQAAGNLRQWAPAQHVQLLAGEWWAPLQPWWGLLDMVVANPPYIPTATWAALEPLVQRHEPRLALDGGADGLAAIRPIAAGAPAALAPGGWLVLEHQYDQSAAVLELLRSAGLEQVSAHPDLEGNERFAVARRPAGTHPETASQASSCRHP